MNRDRFVSSSPGILFALASAVLFGASTPMAKLLLGAGVDPWLLAGLLYLFSGLGLAALLASQRLLVIPSREAPLRRADSPWLVLAIATGGVAGPVLLMLGLAGTGASTASLLLNLEGLATMLIAWVVFRENADARILVGAAAILAGAGLLSWQGEPGQAGWSALAIAAACVAWAIDNNVTRKISSGDPVQIAMLKGLAAGSINLFLAFIINHASLPQPALLAGTALIGFLGYGVSLILFVLALRHLGAARTGAYFAVAPFIGTLLAVTLLSEPITVRLVAAALLMGIGLWLHLTESHAHRHRHLPQEHEHRHSHDLHHEHQHGRADPPGEPHSHRHVHKPVLHVHPHYPDLHHRHTHTHEG
jgi:drug/metabolite transporter (DMT)-like permease